MELLYLWILNDNKTIKEQGFNFSAKFDFFFDYDSKKTEFELEITQKKHFVEIFPENIKITAIVGENGVGKTNLMHLLIDLLSNNQGTNNLPLYSQYIVAFYNKDKEQIEVTYYLNEKSIFLKANKLIKTVIQQQKIIENKDFGNFYIENNYILNNSKVIYYNPAFDLRDYPPKISNEYRKYIDISTNALIEADTLFSDIYIPENYDNVLLHKYSNTFRFFELSISGLADLNEINIPKKFEIHFDRNHFNPTDGQRMLSYQNIEIFEQLDKLIVIAFQKINSKIRKERNNQNYLKEKLKVEFSYCLLHNFFQNINSEYELDIEVEKDDLLKSDNIFRVYDDFFEKQKINNYLHSLYSNVLKAIDNTNELINDDDKYFITDNISAVEIFSTYVNYINSFPTNTKYDFLHIKWRNISSGEKLMLDLYSRLYFAKKKIENQKIDFVYILIDEGELGFHPQWQKEYLSKLIQFLEYCFVGKDIQVILTTHSPIILSDIPKNNVIFIEKTHDNLMNVTSIAENLETFASNIHSILIYPFFIKNGLIGSYAKEKINNIIRQLNDNENSPNNIDKIRKLIMIIGEPVLKRKLSEMFEYRFEIPIDMEQEISFLEKRLSKLNEIKNNKANDKNK